MAATVNVLNNNWHAPSWLLEKRTPPSLVPVHLLEKEELTKICFKCVCHTQLELHMCLRLQYASAMAAIVKILNINWDVPGRLIERWTPLRLVPMLSLVEEKLTKICFKCVRHKQPELHTSLLLQKNYCYGSYSKSIEYQGRCSWLDFRLQAWHEWASWMERNCQKFVPRAFVVHSLSYRPVCFFSTLLLWQL